jgi:hypothetical protein
VCAAEKMQTKWFIGLKLTNKFVETLPFRKGLLLVDGHEAQNVGEIGKVVVMKGS